MVDTIIESFGLLLTKVIIILLGRISDHIEVTEAHPGCGIGGGNTFKFIEERRTHTRGGRSINVGDDEGEIRGSGSKVGGECVLRGRNNAGSEDRAVPCGENATSTPSDRVVGELIEMTRKERTQLEDGDFREFGFLEEDDIRISCEKFRQNISTFHRVIQAPHIPTANSDASIHSSMLAHHTKDGASAPPFGSVHYCSSERCIYKVQSYSGEAS
jgi:hypothetical protein